MHEQLIHIHKFDRALVGRNPEGRFSDGDHGVHYPAALLVSHGIDLTTEAVRWHT